MVNLVHEGNKVYSGVPIFETPEYGFMKKPNSTLILNCQSHLINKYLSEGFSIIEQNTKQLSLLPNAVKSITNLIDQLKKDYVMVKNKVISAVANTIKQFCIQKNMHTT